jgi:hypothetical protein
MFTSLLSNWKTSLTGLLIIVLAALHTFLGINIPGFNLDLGAAFMLAVGMFTAKDANVTGGTTPQ